MYSLNIHMYSVHLYIAYCTVYKEERQCYHQISTPPLHANAGKLLGHSSETPSFLIVISREKWPVGGGRSGLQKGKDKIGPK